MEEENVSGEEREEAAAPVAQGQETRNEQATETTGENIPLSALQSERAQRQQLQEELKMIKDHLSLMQSQQSQSQQPPQRDEFDGMEDGDVLTLGDFKKLLSKREQHYQGSIEELKMRQKYPDYQEVILKYLPEVVKANPSLRTTLEKSQDYELAYYLAKNSDQYKTDYKKQKKSVEAQRILENSQQAGSLSSMGSTSPISQAKQYRQMSDDDFKELVNKNLGYAA